MWVEQAAPEGAGVSGLMRRKTGGKRRGLVGVSRVAAGVVFTYKCTLEVFGEMGTRGGVGSCHSNGFVKADRV